jgi:hypothetical protein
MIEDLVKAKKISQHQYDLYMLFHATELGRKCLTRMTEEAFMDEPTAGEFSSTGFAFYDGRRSLLRDIHRAIDIVVDSLRENLND